MSDPARLQAALRAIVEQGHDVLAVPPFTVYLTPSDPMRFLNYAIPNGDVEPDREAVERLRAAFRDRDRLPRLEWIEEAAPRLADVLAGAGMEEELRAPLMACSPDELVEVRANVDDLDVAPVGDTDLRDCGDVQRVAFGGEPLGELDEPSDPRRNGGGAVLARVSGTPVAVAAWTPIVDGVTEVAGVATSEDWRGRGLGGVVTAAAARAAFAAGAIVAILSPGDETAQRVYARTGFHRVATMLHHSDPE